MRKILFIIFVLSLLGGCVSEANYRGVPDRQWQKLTTEQKQLIVDQAYEEDVNGIK